MGFKNLRDRFQQQIDSELKELERQNPIKPDPIGDEEVKFKERHFVLCKVLSVLAAGLMFFVWMVLYRQVGGTWAYNIHNLDKCLTISYFIMLRLIPIVLIYQFIAKRLMGAYYLEHGQFDARKPLFFWYLYRMVSTFAFGAIKALLWPSIILLFLFLNHFD